MQPQLSNGDKTSSLKPLHFSNGDFFFFLYLEGSEKQALLQKMNLHKFHSYTHTQTHVTLNLILKALKNDPSAKVINPNIWLLDVGVAYQQHRLERKKNIFI